MSKVDYYFRVSALSTFEFCPKRSRIELFKQSKQYTSIKGKSPRSIGVRLHYLFSYPFRSFDRVLVRSRLGNRVFEKQVENIIVRGKYDDLRVVFVDGKKYTILLELKTTSKKYISTFEIKTAIRQLQLYMWLMKEDLEKLGFPLWKNSVVEIYSQRNGELIKRIPVYYDVNIEEWIKRVRDSIEGLVPIKVPSIKVCKFCPKSVKSVCNWYQSRMRRKKKWM